MSSSAAESTRTVGPYRLIGQIGEGGMGVVFLAQAPDDRRVALKVLRPSVIGDGNGRARLAREVTSLRRVRSPRIADVYDADPWGETPYVVMRYVPGPSLREVVDHRGPLTGHALMRFARGLAQALVVVHRADVLHRDVKPSNVLIEEGDPVLIDFGLAQLADDMALTQTGWLLGTPGYLLTLVATIYAFYTFVLGAPLLGKSSAEKALPFTLVVVLCAIVLAFLTSFVFSGMTTMAPRMNSGASLLLR